MAADKVSASRLIFRPTFKPGCCVGDSMKPWQREPHDLDIEQWSRSFMTEVRANPSARRAWRRIQRADFPDKAAIGLFLYWSGTEPDQAVGRWLGELHGRAIEIAKKLKEVTRLMQLEDRRSPKPPHSRGRPRKPAKVAWEEALKAPLGDGGMATVGSAIERLERDTGRRFTPTQWRRILVKSGGKRSAMNGKLCLAALQALARDYKVDLGYRSIKALADCAAPKLELDDRDLQRYLKDARGVVRQYVDLWKRARLSRKSFAHLFAPHK